MSPGGTPESYVRLLGAIDARFVVIRRYYGHHMQCSAQCDECCHYVFDISPIEAIYLDRALGSLKPDVYQELRVHADYWLTALRTASTDASSPQLVLLSSSGLRIPCPLLCASVCCVYEARPVVCRAAGGPVINPLRRGEFVAPCSKNFQNFDGDSQIETFDWDAISAAKREIQEEAIPLLSDRERRFLARRWTIAEVILEGDE